MTPDIERAARAIAKDLGYDWDVLPETRNGFVYPFSRQALREMAASSLEALAEPFDATVEAAAAAIWEAWCTDQIAPDWAVDVDWETLCRWAADEQHAAVMARDCAYREARAALRAARLAELGRTEG